MKKYICAFVSVILILSLNIMSGCSDFDFNPLGAWEYVEEIYYINGKEAERVEKENMQYESMKYIFEKSGTGYISVNDDRTLDFTYDYDNNKVVIHMKSLNTSSDSENNDDNIIDTEYKIVDNKKNNSTNLIRTEEYKAKDENGKEINVKAEFVLEKT